MKNRIKQIVGVLSLCAIALMCSDQSKVTQNYDVYGARQEVVRKPIYTEQPDILVETISETDGYDNRWGITHIDNETKDILAKLVYLEGNVTGLEGCQKIVVVILNRYADGRFFGGQEASIMSVMSAPRQFGPYWRAANDPSVIATEQEYNAIETVLTGNVDDVIYNAEWLYFNGDGKMNYFW